MNCLLCESTETHFFSVQQKPIRDYWFCRHCELVFMDSSQHLNSSDEKQRYEQHQNQDSVDYRNYLMPVIERVKKYVPHNSMGLDFGCGPDPVLAQSLTESGYYLNLFDPYFFAEQHSLKQKYSFLTCTEVVEHFQNPRLAWQKIVSLINISGYLFIMTQTHSLSWDADMILNVKHYANWAYRRDVTHICFYSVKTFNYICEILNLKIRENFDRGFVAQLN